MARLLPINGPNRTLPFIREPGVNGIEYPARVGERLARLAPESDHDLDCFQGNAVNEIIARVKPAATAQRGLILPNTGPYTHTSIALQAASRLPSEEK